MRLKTQKGVEDIQWQRGMTGDQSRMVTACLSLVEFADDGGDGPPSPVVAVGFDLQLPNSLSVLPAKH
jgi:hypothetical protein